MPRSAVRPVQLLVASALAWTCASHRSNLLPPEPPLAPSAEQSIIGQMEEIVDAFALAESQGAWRERGYFDATENDRIEQLLFQYTTARDGLLGLAMETDSIEPDADGAADWLQSYAAALALLDLDGRIVETFRADPTAVSKLNEAFYRSEIPAGTFERLELEATGERRIREVERAVATLEAERSSPESALVRAAAADASLAALADETRRRAKSVDARLDRLSDHGARILRRPEEAVAHSPMASAGRATKRALEGIIRSSRALLFKSVSRIKSPTAHLIRFDADQKRRIRSVLEPGDLLFSYTAGYVSDVFIPGAFKHALVWVGTPEERAAAGLDAARISTLPPNQRQRMRGGFETRNTKTGESADLIEAVAEGVKFSHLDTILDTHINRFLVLRPRLSAEDRADALFEVFLYLGDSYDFRFDFADASRQVCTELVYRAYDERGPLRFELVDRIGRETLSADDIIGAAMGRARHAYDIVLYAEEDPASSDHAARILAGEAARERVNDLLASTKPAPAS